MILDLPYLSRDKDRHGNVRIYFRRGEEPKIRLRAALGSPEFLDEYRAAAAGPPAAPSTSYPKATAGSLRWLCLEYYGSGEFRRLGDSTRHVRKLILDKLCMEQGKHPYAGLQAKHIRRLRDARADTPEAANSVVKALRQVYKWAIEAEFARTNPARDVPYLQGNNPDGFHTWTVGEVEQYRERHPLGTKAHLAMSLLLFTGVRRSDVVTLGRQMARGGWLEFTEAKGRRRKPKPRAVPILPELQAALDAAPSNHLTYLVTELGASFTRAGFGNWFRDRCDEAGLNNCSAHGLRKAGATIAAENGATDRQLMAIYGWDTPKQATTYTKKADRRRLAGDAMHLLVPRQAGNEIVPLPGDAVPPAAKSLK